MKFRGIYLVAGQHVVRGRRSWPRIRVRRPAFRSVSGPAGAEQAQAASARSRRTCGEGGTTSAELRPQRPRRSRPPHLPPIRLPPRTRSSQSTASPQGKTEPAANPSDDAAATITKTVNEVNVVFTVTDKHGRYVKNLAKADFSVIDDSKPADQIRSFHNETDLPLQVGLLVDASNSVRDRFKFEQESAIEFLNQTVRPRYDRAFIIGFDVTPEVTQDFTDNTEALSRGVRALRPGGGTAMYDALYFASPRQAAESSSRTARYAARSFCSAMVTTT